MPTLIRNPVARKRLRRLRRRRRAWASLWILGGLFALGLCVDFVANERPLYVRCNGRSFFPVLRYYPESAFVAGGAHTRPDYRRIAASEAFRARPGNAMLFTPIRYGPNEIVPEEELARWTRVKVSFQPEERVAAVNVTTNLAVARAEGAGVFFGVEDDAVRGLSVPAAWRLPGEISEGIARRFRNAEAAPAAAVAARMGPGTPARAEVSLPAYAPRGRAPQTVRLAFREITAGGAAAARMEIRRDLRVAGAPPLWGALPAADRDRVLEAARQSFLNPVAPFTVAAPAGPMRVQFLAEVGRPFRPVPGHWCGIDSAGRDVLARVLHGLRISMLFGFLLVIVSMTLGVLAGALQGYFGGKVDLTGQRLIEIWNALPFLYVMILMGSVYGPSFGLLLFCYALFNWIGISYYVRGEFLNLRRQPFVDAAKALGVSHGRIILRHILPNALTPIVTFFPFSLVGAIGALAALDYLGFGLPPPTPSWGQLLQQAQQFRWAWWLILYPSAALFAVMLMGVFIGEGVRDAYDPRPYSRME